MSSSPKKVLVAGGAGFIGSNVVDGLVKEGYEVGVIDNLVTGSLWNISKHVSTKTIQFYNADITNYEAVKTIVKDYDTVITLAALVSVTRSVENPILTNQVNATGTLNLLKAAVDSSVQRFVYSSSSSVYGDTETLPKREDMKTIPISPYGVSKLAAENYCRTFAKVYGLRTVSLRYFNVYGPRQKYGPYSGVIPIFIKRIIDYLPPVINGDGNQIRDFTFVDDVVSANLLCLKADCEPGSVYNIARGETITINELARTLTSLLGKSELVPVHGPDRPGDIRASYSDIGKARKELGFNPRFELKEGLRRVIDWFQSGNQTSWD